VTHRRAGRSARNYPHQVAERLSLRLVDVTCSGATTANILRTWRRRQPPQIDAVTADAKLVTITAGGNDVGYIGGLVRASMVAAVRNRLPFLPDLRKRHAVPGEEFDRLVTSLVNVVGAVRSRAPGARIMLVDYLTVLGPDATKCREMPLDEDTVRDVRTTADGLAEAFRTAARRSGAHLVSASSASVRHGVGSAEPWVTGFRRPVPYHPTLAGMTAVAELVLRQLG
jgi:lysophospholipase L1-like esterase